MVMQMVSLEQDRLKSIRNFVKSISWDDEDIAQHIVDCNETLGLHHPDANRQRLTDDWKHDLKQLRNGKVTLPLEKICMLALHFGGQPIRLLVEYKNGEEETARRIISRFDSAKGGSEGTTTRSDQTDGSSTREQNGANLNGAHLTLSSTTQERPPNIKELRGTTLENAFNASGLGKVHKLVDAVWPDLSDEERTKRCALIGFVFRGERMLPDKQLSDIERFLKLEPRTLFVRDLTEEEKKRYFYARVNREGAKNIVLPRPQEDPAPPPSDNPPPDEGTPDMKKDIKELRGSALKNELEAANKRPMDVIHEIRPKASLKERTALSNLLYGVTTGKRLMPDALLKEVAANLNVREDVLFVRELSVDEKKRYRYDKVNRKNGLASRGTTVPDPSPPARRKPVRRAKPAASREARPADVPVSTLSMTLTKETVANMIPDGGVLLRIAIRDDGGAQVCFDIPDKRIIGHALGLDK